MSRLAAALLVLGGLATPGSPVAAEGLTERPAARFEASRQAWRAEGRLARQTLRSSPPIVIVPCCPAWLAAERGVDGQIRRLGELIRRQEAGGR